MPKTILLPEQLVTDKTKWPKVIVLDEHEQRKPNGDLIVGRYKFSYNGRFYRIIYYYKHHKCIKSQLSYV